MAVIDLYGRQIDAIVNGTQMMQALLTTVDKNVADLTTQGDENQDKFDRLMELNEEQAEHLRKIEENTRFTTHWLEKVNDVMGEIRQDIIDGTASIKQAVDECCAATGKGPASSSSVIPTPTFSFPDYTSLLTSINKKMTRGHRDMTKGFRDITKALAHCCPGTGPSTVSGAAGGRAPLPAPSVPAIPGVPVPVGTPTASPIPPAGAMPPVVPQSYQQPPHQEEQPHQHRWVDLTGPTGSRWPCMPCTP